MAPYCTWQALQFGEREMGGLKGLKKVISFHSLCLSFLEGTLLAYQWKSSLIMEDASPSVRYMIFSSLFNPSNGFCVSMFLVDSLFFRFFGYALYDYCSLLLSLLIRLSTIFIGVNPLSRCCWRWPDLINDRLDSVWNFN